MKTQYFKSTNRGSADYDWLKARYSFSFANYYNPTSIHFGALRVLNDDCISAGVGFDTHPHDNMEIITIPLQGALKHVDSMGHSQVIGAHDVQVMSAGTGITHSEHNNSATDSAYTLQIWIFSDARGHEPRYDQASFDETQMKNNFCIMVGPKISDAPLWIHQNAWISRAKIDTNNNISYDLHSKNSGVYAFLIDGIVEMNAVKMQKRDALAISETEKFDILAIDDSDILIIEVPV